MNYHKRVETVQCHDSGVCVSEVSNNKFRQHSNTIQLVWGIVSEQQASRGLPQSQDVKAMTEKDQQLRISFG